MDCSEFLTGEFEYELIDISWSLDYDFSQDEFGPMVRDEGVTHEGEATPIEYDENGIPLNNCKEAFALRKKIISEFYHSWKEMNPEQQVYNTALHEYILVRGISITETSFHAASNYKSTKAVLNLDQVLSCAKVYGYSFPKPGDKNQKEFDKIIVMTHDIEGIGKIKLTVGIRNKSHAKIQYGITVPSTDKPLIEPSLQVKEKKRKKTKK